MANDFQKWLMNQGYSRQEGSSLWLKDGKPVPGEDLYFKLQEWKESKLLHEALTTPLSADDGGETAEALRNSFWKSTGERVTPCKSHSVTNRYSLWLENKIAEYKAYTKSEREKDGGERPGGIKTQKDLM